MDFCDAPGPAPPAPLLGTTVAFWDRKRTRGAAARRALLEKGPTCILKALRVAGLRRGTRVPAVLLGHADQPGTRGGGGSRGAPVGASGSARVHQGLWMNSKTPGSCGD